MSGPYLIEALAPHHDRSSFACGVEPLDHYLRHQVGQDTRRRIANCFVAVETERRGIVGYYTLSAAQVPLSALPSDLGRRLPRYPVVPAVRLGRLAIDLSAHGRGLGAALLADAVRRSLESEIAAFALLVDPKDESAKSFYHHHGFVPLPEPGEPMILPLTRALFPPPSAR